MGLFSLFSDANEKKARNAQRDALRQAEARAAPAFEEGQTGFETAYGEALGEYDPYVSAYTPAAASYADALGLSGPEGNTRATESFQASPGYQFQLDQGLTELERRAARRGMLGSGNLSQDTLEYAGGLADQEYGDYLDRLFKTSEAGRDVAGSRAQIRTRGGEQDYAHGLNLGNLYSGTETGIGTADANYQIGKDASGANQLAAITKGISLGARLLGF